MCLLGCSVFGQTNSAAPVTNWGKLVCDAQLAIELPNSTVARGTNVNLKCWIKNSSTNSIDVPISRPSPDFYVIMTNSFGRLYELTRDPAKEMVVSHIAGRVNAGETNAYEIPLIFKTNIQSGVYKLFAKRRFGVNGKWHELPSNVLEIQVE